MIIPSILNSTNLSHILSALVIYVQNDTLSRITNGIEESLSSKIKVVMEIAFGFEQTEYLRTIGY